MESAEPSPGWTRRGLTLLAATVVPIVAVFALFEPYPQPESYFELADDRTVFGVANFWNVASNLLFLVFGIQGLRLLTGSSQLTTLPGLRSAYLVLFVGVMLTAFGSGWFHLSPNNDSLFWDRLPMTIAFMSLFAIILGEHVSGALARGLLWPLLLAGAASVYYWDYTESMNRGDLRFYGIVQFLPMLLIPAILVLYRSAFDTISFYWIAMGLYAAAKMFEFLDVTIYAAGHIVSGHSLKHVAASLVPLVLINGMKNRQMLTEENE